MNELINSVLGLIAFSVVVICIMLTVVALFRPKELNRLVRAVQDIALALTRKLPDRDYRDATNEKKEDEH